MATHPYLVWPGPIAFAHRGGASDNPENTMPAFQHAVDLGYRYLETDVHATKDGVLVAFHDADLSRTCGVAGRIEEMTWTEVAEARVDGKEPIPRFDELLRTYPQHRFNIDCKADRAVAPLVEEIRRLDCLDRICVGAFSDRRLRRIRSSFGDELCTSFGPIQTGLQWLIGRTMWGGQAAQIPIRQGPISLATERFVRNAHRHGVHVHMWTIDDPDDIRRLLDLGVDGVMTDKPQILKDVLIERDQWVDGSA